MSVIAISGKKQSGKDTVAKILSYKLSLHYNLKVPILKYADPVKKCVSIITNCDIDSLEDNNFKTRYYYNFYSGLIFEQNQVPKEGIYIDSIEEYNHVKTAEEFASMDHQFFFYYSFRFLLQFIGTEIGRNMLGTNIWINALFNSIDVDPVNREELVIVSDSRFLNELRESKFSIRLTRSVDNEDNHESETALDGHDIFDWTIDNQNMDLEELERKVTDIAHTIYNMTFRT